MSKITITNAAEMIERTVKHVGGGAHVIVPKAWSDSRVAVVRLEDEKTKIIKTACGVSDTLKAIK